MWLDRKYIRRKLTWLDLTWLDLEVIMIQLGPTWLGRSWMRFPPSTMDRPVSGETLLVRGLTPWSANQGIHQLVWSINMSLVVPFINPVTRRTVNPLNWINNCRSIQWKATAFHHSGTISFYILTITFGHQSNLSFLFRPTVLLQDAICLKH